MHVCAWFQWGWGHAGKYSKPVSTFGQLIPVKTTIYKGKLVLVSSVFPESFSSNLKTTIAMKNMRSPLLDPLVNIYGLYVVAGVTGALLFYLCVNEVVRSRKRIAGLNSPKGFPVVGNLFQVLDHSAQKYQHWSKTLGDVYQVQLANTPIIIINSAAAAKRFFISNSQTFSSRPITYTFGRIASSSAGLTIGTSPYDDSLKRKKKGAASALNRPAIQTYIPYLDRESRTFLEDLLHYGKGGTIAIDPLPLIQRLSLSLVMTINWGVRMPSHEDPLFQEIIEVEEELNRFRSTVGNLQDHIPLLRLNPFSRTSSQAREMRRRRDVYLGKLDADLADKVRRGVDQPCIQANVLRDTEAKLNEVELKSISLSILGGGFETVSNTVHWTIGYLAHHPEIQDRAFDAIREFQGPPGPGGESGQQLCDAADDLKCPYVAALAKEALRYFTVIPLALPRKSIRDMEYDGKLIPAGTTAYLNAWACNYGKPAWANSEPPDPGISSCPYRRN